MTFPALMALPLDQALKSRPTVQMVYVFLLSELDFVEARRVKIAIRAEQLEIRKQTMIDALNLLVKRGYLCEHERDSTGVRRFTLAWSRKPETACGSPERTPLPA